MIRPRWAAWSDGGIPTRPLVPSVVAYSYPFIPAALTVDPGASSAGAVVNGGRLAGRAGAGTGWHGGRLVGWVDESVVLGVPVQAAWEAVKMPASVAAATGLRRATHRARPGRC